MKGPKWVDEILPYAVFSCRVLKKHDECTYPICNCDCHGLTDIEVMANVVKTERRLNRNSPARRKMLEDCGEEVLICSTLTRVCFSIGTSTSIWAMEIPARFRARRRAGVQVMKTKDAKPPMGENGGNLEFALFIPASSWASVVASMSALGETGVTLRVFEAFQKG